MRAFALVAICLAACAPTPRQPEPWAAAVEKPKPKPPDLTNLFPPKDRVTVEIVDDHLLDSDVLPGGNLATYRRGAKSWQLFVVATKSAEAAAILLLDYKTTLTDPKYNGAFGAYVGAAGSTPIFVLQKSSYLAGIAGLNEKDADPVAREFAARIR